jgi:hypothetical protein
MRSLRYLVFWLLASTPLWAGSTSSAMLTCSKEVRKQSFADNTLFHDMLAGIGGVGMADAVRYPHAAAREVAKIEVDVPYDNRKTGIERWTIKHDDGTQVVYTLYFVPDGNGGTNFGVKFGGNARP